MPLLSISEKANPNYLAKVVTLSATRKHSNADRLQCTMIDGNNVIVGLEHKPGDIGIFFPIECQIDVDWLKENNLFKEKTLNSDPEKTPGFFEQNCRVKCLKLRGEKSQGFWVPASYFKKYGSDSEFLECVNNEFDTISGTKLVTKYVPKINKSQALVKDPKPKKDIERKKDILVPGQFNFHIDTPQFGKNVHRIKPDSNIVITQKLHGTSFIVSKVLTKRKLSWWEKFSRLFGAKIQETEYRNLYASRKVIKNIGLPQSGYYNKDVWEHANIAVLPWITDGMTVYGEIVGYVPDSELMIQKDYDYGCEVGKCAIYVYRITTTSSSGQVYDWPWMHVKSWCEKVGGEAFKAVPELWKGNVLKLFGDLEYKYADYSNKNYIETNSWHDALLILLEKHFLNKKCCQCKNDVWDEGIVIRIDDNPEFEVYKFKSFNFMQYESKMLDQGEADLETIESQIE